MAEFNFNDKNFEKEVIKSDMLTVVDFWAPWCGPCQLQGPIIDELIKNFKDKSVKIGKFNVDEGKEIPSNYGIMSIPAILFFKDGKVIQQLTGLQAKEDLFEKINKLI